MVTRCRSIRLGLVGIFATAFLAVYAITFSQFYSQMGSLPMIDLSSDALQDDDVVQVQLSIAAFSIGNPLGLNVQIRDGNRSKTTRSGLTTDNKLNEAVTVEINGFTNLFKPGTDIVNAKWSPSVALDQNNILLYPWDSYTFPMRVSVSCASQSGRPCDLALSIRTSAPISRKYDFQVDPAQEFAERRLTLTVSRRQIIYQVFLLVAFWVIMVIEISLIIMYTVFHAKLEAPVLIFKTTLLFALPAIRNSMPESPPLGIVLDYAAYYWAMFVAILSFMIVGLRYILDLSRNLPSTPVSKAASEKEMFVSAEPQQRASSKESAELEQGNAHRRVKSGKDGRDGKPSLQTAQSFDGLARRRSDVVVIVPDSR